MDGMQTSEEARIENRKMLSYLNSHMVDFDTKSRLPDSNYITSLAETEMQRKKQKIDYLVIDPYVFINVTEGGNRATETETRCSVHQEQPEFWSGLQSMQVQ